MRGIVITHLASLFIEAHSSPQRRGLLYYHDCITFWIYLFFGLHARSLPAGGLTNTAQAAKCTSKVSGRGGVVFWSIADTCSRERRRSLLF
jgi:hypothetical protein